MEKKVVLKLSANGYWKFYRGSAPKGSKIGEETSQRNLLAYQVDYDDSTWETVHLPHTVREERLNCSGGYNYVGECWYRKKFYIEKDWVGKHLFLEFEGAMQRADVWLDGVPFSVRYGGFLPMGFDLSNLSEGEHLIVIKLDNSDSYDIPPAKPQGELDFCYFGGLYRNAWMYVADKLHFSLAVHQNKVASGGLFVRYPFVSEEKADVRVRTHIVNGYAQVSRGEVRLFFNGQEMASKQLEFPANEELECEFDFIVENPNLWSPENPYLYDLTAKIYLNNDLVDERTERIGIRHIVFEKDGIVINGKKSFINGVNRHQEYPYVGFALPDSLQYRDLKLLRDMGTRCIRIAHYPPDSTFMKYCDELGILCIIPTPGWQIHPNNVQFDMRSYENTRRIIRWHRNHPSVLMWEPILNETDYPEYFALEQLRCVREECADGESYCACDLHGRCSELFPVHLSIGNDKGIPEFVREYGDSYIEQYGPMDTTYRVRRGKNTGFYTGGESAMLWSANARYEWYRRLVEDTNACGGCIWAGIDHNRGYEPTEAAVGMLDFLRLKKYSYYMFECQQDFELVGGKCFIASEWTEESSHNVSVYTNCEEIRLFLNGKEVGRLSANGKTNLHAPVIFENVPFEKGTLRAEGIVKDKTVAVYEVRTPEKAVKLLLVPHFEDLQEWVADGADLLMVHVLAVDEFGTVDGSFESEVSFTVEGDATIVGSDQAWVKANPMNAEAGKCGVLLRAGVNVGKVVVRAFANGLQTGELVLTTIPSTRENLLGVEYPKLEVLPTYEVDEKELFSTPISIKESQAYHWDVGMNKTAIASSCADGYVAENVNRESMGKPWIASNVTLPQWWQCDLEKEYPLNGIFVGWEKDGAWYDYDVEISNNGIDFVCVIQGKASGQSRNPERFPTGTKARFVRIVVRSITSQIPAGIYRVEIFGNPNL